MWEEISNLEVYHEELSLWPFYYLNLIFNWFLIYIFKCFYCFMVFALPLSFGSWSCFYHLLSFLDSTSFCCISSYSLAIIYCLLSIYLFLEVPHPLIVIFILWSSCIAAVALTNLGWCSNHLVIAFFLLQILCIHIE